MRAITAVVGAQARLAGGKSLESGRQGGRAGRQGTLRVHGGTTWDFQESHPLSAANSITIIEPLFHNGALVRYVPPCSASVTYAGILDGLAQVLSSQASKLPTFLHIPQLVLPGCSKDLSRGGGAW